MILPNIGLAAEIGGKTEGWLMGMHYDAGFYFNGGFRIVW
jgi:hypothetical protein